MSIAQDDAIIKRFIQLTESAATLKDLENIDAFLKICKDKSSLRATAYNHLLQLLSDENSTASELAFAYFITGQTYEEPEWRCMYFYTACDYFRDASASLGLESNLFCSDEKIRAYADYRINLHDVFYGGTKDD